jgi:hypothetical protein
MRAIKPLLSMDLRANLSMKSANLCAPPLSAIPMLLGTRFSAEFARFAGTEFWAAGRA